VTEPDACPRRGLRPGRGGLQRSVLSSLLVADC
jgi:hypothetical protein